MALPRFTTQAILTESFAAGTASSRGPGFSQHKALFAAVAHFFGGRVSFMDGDDDRDADVRVESEDSIWGHAFSPNDGEEWDEIRQRKIGSTACPDPPTS